MVEEAEVALVFDGGLDLEGGLDGEGVVGGGAVDAAMGGEVDVVGKEERCGGGVCGDGIVKG